MEVTIIVITAVRCRPHEAQIFFAEKSVPPAYDVEELTWLPVSQSRAEPSRAWGPPDSTGRKAPVNTVSQGSGVSLVIRAQPSC